MTQRLRADVLTFSYLQSPVLYSQGVEREAVQLTRSKGVYVPKKARK